LAGIPVQRVHDAYEYMRNSNKKIPEKLNMEDMDKFLDQVKTGGASGWKVISLALGTANTLVIMLIAFYLAYHHVKFVLQNRSGTEREDVQVSGHELQPLRQ